MKRITRTTLAFVGIAFLIVCGCRQSQVATNAQASVESREQAAESREQSKVEKTSTSSTKIKETAQQTGKNTIVPASKSTKTAAKLESSSAANQAPVQNETTSSDKQEELVGSSVQPATVLQASKALDFSKFPKPKGARNLYVFHSSLHFEAAGDSDSALIYVTDELLKRGFVEKDSVRTRMATVTVNIDDRPMTIYLASSLAGNLTHVTMYNHQGIDTSLVPRLQASSPVDNRVDKVYYQSPIGVREGQQILRSEIQKKDLSIARMSNSNGTAKIFEKDGLKFVVHVENAENMEFEHPQQVKPKSTRVSILNRGNVDVTKLPRPAGFDQTKQAYTTIFGSAKFFSGSSAANAAKQAAEELEKAGWKNVEPIRDGVSDIQHLLTRNGTLVQIQATEFGDDRTHVDYSLSMLSFDIPNDIETRIVRVDSAAPQMFFSTTANVQTLREFYIQHLESIGWKPDESNQISNTDKFAQLYYGNYHQPVVLEIQSKGPQSTWVEMRPVDSEAIAKVFSKARTREKQAEIATNDAETTATPEAIQEVESAISDVNVPDSSQQIEALARKQMEEALKNVPAEQAAEIKKMMEQQLGAMFDDEGAKTGDSSEDPVATFASAAEISGEADSQTTERTVPEGKIAAEDFPIPKNAKNITRDFEMITFSVNGVTKNAKFVTEKLVAQDWKTRGEQIIESDLGMLRFQKGVGTINVSLTVDDRRDPPVHVVAHGDGIWFPESDEYGDGLAYEGEMEEGDFEEDAAFDEFEVKEFEGMPLPEGAESPVKMRSQFRSEFVTSVEGDLKTIHEFFQNSAASTDWKVQSHKLNKEYSMIAMAGDRGELIVELKKFEGEIEISLAFRDPKVAQEHGFVPPTGKARLILANIAKVESTIVINGKSHKLAPEQGAEDPDDTIRLDVEPGKFTYSIIGAGRKEQSGKLKMVADGTWGIVVFPELGHMAERMY